jgi:AcrR family transcriptional regulator
VVDSSPDADVRSRILDVATGLFAERGYAGTSIQAIAQAAGITKPTLVYHFRSKAGLRREVVASLLGHWRDEVPRLMAAAASGGPRLASLLEALFDFFRDDPRRAKLLLREMLDDPDEMASLLAEHLQPWTRLLTEAMRVGQRQGVIAQDADPEAYVQLVVTTTIGVLAVGDRANALVLPEPSVDAQLGELVRTAHRSLFPSRTHPTHARSRDAEEA